MDNFEKLYNKGNLKIVYLGGSITEGAGASDKSRRWSTQVTAYLNSLPLGNTVFTEINQGIGGTESTYGLLRLNRDVCAYEPDIVFIDFSLNDEGLSEKLSAVMYEGIIRKLMSLPKIPYIICIGVVANRNKRTRACVHKKIAAHYGIEFIDVQEGMDAFMGEANIGVNTERDSLYRPDNVHPVEKGYDFYTKYILQHLSGESFRKPSAEPLDNDFCNFSGKFINAKELTSVGDWTPYGSDGSWNEKNLGRGGCGLMSADKNASLSFKFKGTAFMLCYRLGTNFGKIAFELDGKEDIYDLYYETDNQPVTGISRFGLDDAEHVISVRPLGEKNEKSTSCDVKIDFVVVPE
ncbi:MAG: SGNH/GDSL hydrolase family protein [Clostridia bacterium]|nr:SGNH/GDSL hydrolase family protein [Clostridia bacterium]